MCNETCTDGDKSITRDPDSALKLIKEPDRIWLPRRNESGGMIDICRFLSPSPPCFPLSTSISDRRDHRVRLTVIYHVIPVRAIRPQRSKVRVHVRTGETCSSDLRAARKLIGPRIDACSPLNLHTAPFYSFYSRSSLPLLIKRRKRGKRHGLETINFFERPHSVNSWLRFV